MKITSVTFAAAVILAACAQAQESTMLHLDEKTDILQAEVYGLYELIPLDLSILEVQRERLMAYTNAYSFMADPPNDPAELEREKKVLEAYRTIQKKRYESVIRELKKRVHEQNAAFKREFMKASQLKETDLDAIIAAIEAVDDLMVDKRNLSIKVTDPSNVEVTTGFVKGPLHGGGDLFHLHKKGDNWEVVHKSAWTS